MTVNDAGERWSGRISIVSGIIARRLLCTVCTNKLTYRTERASLLLLFMFEETKCQESRPTVGKQRPYVRMSIRFVIDSLD